MEGISLLELNRQIAEVVNTTFDDFVWVFAEISEIRTASNGHCYLELVEKSKRNSSIVARIRGTIWNNRWWIIKETFENSTGQLISAGIKILVCAQVQMHEAYGLSLNIVDIDPNYTLGEMALRRKEIIKRLTDEGMIDMNKETEMPLIPNRIAIISAENAAGYGDFCHQLANNEYSAKFYTRLFPAAMQGANTENSIIEALDKIYDNAEKFDVVVIIRGGGGVADLSSFDSYDLAVNVANFPLPVIVGIGHERDSTILDIVAHTSVKTPTAAAALLIDIMGEQISKVKDFKSSLIEALNWKSEQNHNRLSRHISSIKDTHIKLRDQINRLSLIEEKSKNSATRIIERERENINFISKTIDLVRPENILRRGFSITRVNGAAIKSADTLPTGTIIETETAEGRFKSRTL